MSQPAAQESAPRWTKVLNWIFLVVAVGGLAWMIRSVGFQQIAGSMRRVGPLWFAVVMALELGTVVCEAAAIRAFMRPESRMVPYWRLLAAQLAGAAINSVMPTGKLGEATKVTLLVRRAPRSRVVSAVLLYNLFGFFVSVAILVIGIPLTAALFDLPRQLELSMWLGGGVALALAVLLVWLISRGVSTSLVALLRGLRIISAERRERWRARLVSLDAQLKMTGDARSHGLAAGTGYILASRALSWIQAGLLIWLLSGELDLLFLVASQSGGTVIGWIGGIVPMGIGVSEGGNYLVFKVLGASPTVGLLIVLLRRVRQVLMAVLGLIIMFALQAADRAPPPIRVAVATPEKDPI